MNGIVNNNCILDFPFKYIVIKKWNGKDDYKTIAKDAERDFTI
jgi:hypothetical protein